MTREYEAILIDRDGFVRTRFMHRLTNTSPSGEHVQVLGARVGYWPCLRAPFVQLALGRHLFDVWYGDPSYLARRS